MNREDIIREQLFSLRDEKYRDFHSKLMPTVDKELIIGIRTPALRSYAKELVKKDDGTTAHEYLSFLPHKYYEENNLHEFLIEQIDDFEHCVCEMDKFLSYVDNWATCDCMRPKVFKKHPKELLSYIEKWIESREVYRVRFAVKMLMDFYLDENFEEEFLERVAKVTDRMDDYYIKMVVSWYFATALAKQYESAIKFIERKRLEKWTHNKTIQKAIESYRITPLQKEYLRTLKVK